MSTDEYYNEEDVGEIYSRMCKCGHELYRHANTMQYNYGTGQTYLRISQCTGPDEVGNDHFCTCKEFRREKKE